MKRLNIQYDRQRDCFAEISHVKTDLVYGDPELIPQPWLSYIIPVYKRPDLLEKTLNSVLNQLPVSFPWDIVLVDNETGEGNPTEQLVRRMAEKRILYYRNRENLGPDGNYNRCIETARGKWLAMLHADDLILEDHLRRMEQYIREKEKGKKPLAYISPGYEDFKNENSISLRRDADELLRYKGRLKRYTQLDALISGFSVALPSFGTVMNREVMLSSGGFDKTLGICEDIITPYRLMKRYRVYATPCKMGYHRFEDSESMKTTSIFQICEAMCDFREYMFGRNAGARLWGKIARVPFFDDLAGYCAYLSRFSGRKLGKADFAYIFPERKTPGPVSKALYNVLSGLYFEVTGADSFQREIEFELAKLLPELRRRSRREQLVIYGTGKMGSIAGRLLKRKYGIKAAAYMVTEKDETEAMLNGIPIRSIRELKSTAEHCFVLIATNMPDFFREMQAALEDCGFPNYIALARRFRAEP